MKKIEKIIEHIPKTPGIYLMKNKSGKIIYIWKSVNLKSRVNSYFNGKSKLNFAKQNMIKQVSFIDFIETKNELEALVLETNYIKNNKPKYNILMKDDKNLTYIKITDSEIPEVYKTRIRNNNWTYFWPYTSTLNVSEILKTIRKIFKIRSCKMEFWTWENGKIIITKKFSKTIPCLDYYIWLCPGPCLLDAHKIDIYQKNIESLKDFLKWNIWKIITSLEKEMREKATNLEFEEASKIKEQIKYITELKEKQIARDIISWNNDILVYLTKYSKNYIWLTQIRNGEIIWMNNFLIENKLEEEKNEIISDFLKQHYVGNNCIVPKIEWIRKTEQCNRSLRLITNEKISDKLLVTYLKNQHISIENPSIWPKLDIINFTKNNLLNFAYKQELGQISKKTLTKNTQISILEKLGYEFDKKRDIIFECYDISHISGNFTVASRSVIVNGKSDTSKYKKYKLKTIAEWEVNDFKSIAEILERRTLEAIKLNNWPDLIIIDWWKWQLSSAVWAISVTLEKIDPSTSSGWQRGQKINICSIAKREEEIFVPGNSKPIIFGIWTPELMLLQKIRDEAHRFAISFNRTSRNKAMKKNILEELPWFGSKTRQKLLKLAGSVDNIATISENEIEKILNKNQIETLKDYWII